jgi:hypothetical protein
LTTENFIKESNSFKKMNNGGKYQNLKKLLQESRSKIYPSCNDQTQTISLKNFIEEKSKEKSLKVITIGKDINIKEFFVKIIN